MNIGTLQVASLRAAAQILLREITTQEELESPWCGTDSQGRPISQGHPTPTCLTLLSSRAFYLLSNGGNYSIILKLLLSPLSPRWVVSSPRWYSQ